MTTKHVSVDEVDWDKLDKKKFFMYGAGMFSGVTATLYPLSVIKTKQMTLPGVSGGFSGARQTAVKIWKAEGPPGLYRGFGTVLFGTIPARVVYLNVLEWTKSQVQKAAVPLELSEPSLAGLSNFVGGAVASMATQTVTVPMDVISSKQIVHGDETVHTKRSSAVRPAPSNSHGPTTPPSTSATPPTSAAGAVRSVSQSSSASSAVAAAATSAAADRQSAVASTSGTATAPARPQRVSGLYLVRTIVKAEGVMGLYRGFGASVATFVPSSAVWWGSYGLYQKLIWSAIDSLQPRPLPGVEVQPYEPSLGETMSVQTTASVSAGCTSALITTPLDLIKTRIQVAYRRDGHPVTFGTVFRQVMQEDGPTGFLRGAFPRMLNASLWGTCMVTVYEFLKRVCQKDEDV